MYFIQQNSLAVVIFLKATKGKSENRISLKRQQILKKNDKDEKFLDFYICLFEEYRMKI